MPTKPRPPLSLGPRDRLYARPLGLLHGRDAEHGIDAGSAWRLGGGAMAFGCCEIIVRSPDRDARRGYVLGVSDLPDWLNGIDDASAKVVRASLDRLSQPRNLKSVDLARPLIMAIVNVTPDSFTGDGLSARPGDAIAKGFEMAGQGADIVDVGGESTRPGSAPVSAAEQLDRVIPVIEGLRECGKPISIDTRSATVMRAALEAGATIINDVSALTFDPDSLEVAAASRAPVVLMHCQGTPATMHVDPRYRDVALDVYDYLEDRLGACLAAGIEAERLIVDPGIGFGKTARHNRALVADLALFHGLGRPILLGVSRKKFVASRTPQDQPREGLGGSLGAALAGLAQGAHILRVHDVGESVRAVEVWTAITESGDRD